MEPKEAQDRLKLITDYQDMDSILRGSEFPDGLFGASESLRSVEGACLRFAAFAGLGMKLIDRAYQSLEEDVSREHFASSVSDALQRFMSSFREEDHLCYPHFLLHGIARPTFEEVLDKIDHNAEIIHSTLAIRSDAMKRMFPLETGRSDYRILASNGTSEDFFGIATTLQEADADQFTPLISKVSFFLDLKDQSIYVTTVQGANPQHEKATGREGTYQKACGVLARDPRTFHLDVLAARLRDEGFSQIRVINAKEHPLTIEDHPGFSGHFEKAVKKAGIARERDCYLEQNWHTY